MIDRVKQILESAEADIRIILGEVALTASVEDINWLAAVAKQLHRLGQEAGGGFHYSPGAEETSSEYNATPAPSTSASSRPRVPATQSRGGRSKKDQYPRFTWEDDGETLVKIGWSKKKRKEYVHRASRQIFDLARQKIDNLGADGKVFSMEDVLPLTDPDTGKEISTYKVYLCVAYLKSQGKIERGREGIRLNTGPNH